MLHTQAEEEFLAIEDLMETGGVEMEQIVLAERQLMIGMGMYMNVYAPYRPLAGILSQLEQLVNRAGTRPRTAQMDANNVRRLMKLCMLIPVRCIGTGSNTEGSTLAFRDLHEAARAIIDTLLSTDVPLLHPPGDIH